MFNRDGLFGKKDETGRAEPRNDARGAVNVTPGLGTNPVTQRRDPPPVAETPRPDLRFAEPAASKPAPKAEESIGSRLIVGPDIKLRGVEITDCDTLVVEGRVEASMDSRVIQIAENGVFSGTVSIDVAEIRGRFEGELTARKQLVIHASGRVSGRIRYGTIRIEEGGEPRQRRDKHPGHRRNARRAEPRAIDAREHGSGRGRTVVCCRPDCGLKTGAGRKLRSTAGDSHAGRQCAPSGLAVGPDPGKGRRRRKHRIERGQGAPGDLL
jgi:cytoskeletal protein CcmA (bactofilin family)